MEKIYGINFLDNFVWYNHYIHLFSMSQQVLYIELLWNKPSTWLFIMHRFQIFYCITTIKTLHYSYAGGGGWKLLYITYRCCCCCCCCCYCCCCYCCCCFCYCWCFCYCCCFCYCWCFCYCCRFCYCCCCCYCWCCCCCCEYTLKIKMLNLNKCKKNKMKSKKRRLQCIIFVYLKYTLVKPFKILILQNSYSTLNWDWRL